MNNQKHQKIKLHGTPTKEFSLTKELKKKINQNKQTSKVAVHRQAAREKLQWGGRLGGWGWLNGKLRLRVDCGLWRGLLWWEKLPVSHGSPLESVLETSRRPALFLLWPLPNRQPSSAAKRFALRGWILQAQSPYNLSGAPRQRNMVQMKEQRKTSER